MLINLIYFNYLFNLLNSNLHNFQTVAPIAHVFVAMGRQASIFAGAPGHHHHSPVQGQGSPAFRASGVQGHRRDFLRIQDPLPTQGTSLQDIAQQCCC
jgi:hypothetical protein